MHKDEVDRRTLRLAPKDPGIYRRCGCTEIGPNGKRRELGMSCPKLVKLKFDKAGNLKTDDEGRALWDWDSKHGLWAFQIDVAPPRGSGKERQRIRKGGFASKTEAKHARAEIAAKGDTAKKRKVGSTALTTEQALNDWLAGRRKIRENTRVSYEGHIENYLVPFLGKIKWRDLDVSDVDAMFQAIEARNEEIRESLKVNPRGRRHDNLTKTQKEAGVKREQRRIAGPATLQRIRATGRKAWNDSVKAGLTSGVNPFSMVELESGEAPPPEFWRSETEAHWRATGEVPSSTMVWTPEQTGHFLDTAVGDQYYELFELAAVIGARRGEMCGLRWVDVDFGEGTLMLRVQLTVTRGKVKEGPVKSKAGNRPILLDPDSVAVLRKIRKRQMEDKLRWGSAWVDSGRVFTQENGAELNPDRVYDRFKQISARADLPPVSLHGMRRGMGSTAAVVAAEAGIPVKAVSATMGHADPKVTNKHYVVPPEEAKRVIVAGVRAAIPRKASGTEQAM